MQAQEPPNGLEASAFQIAPDGLPAKRRAVATRLACDGEVAATDVTAGA